MTKLLFFKERKQIFNINKMAVCDSENYDIYSNTNQWTLLKWLYVFYNKKKKDVHIEMFYVY